MRLSIIVLFFCSNYLFISCIDTCKKQLIYGPLSLFPVLDADKFLILQKVRDSANSLSTPDHLDLHGDQREAALTSGFPTGLARSFDVASSSKAAVPDSKQYRNPANEPLPSSSHSQTDLGSRHIPPNMLGKFPVVYMINECEVS